jgi:hypothetical protein
VSYTFQQAYEQAFNSAGGAAVEALNFTPVERLVITNDGNNNFSYLVPTVGTFPLVATNMDDAKTEAFAIWASSGYRMISDSWIDPSDVSNCYRYALL